MMGLAFYSYKNKQQGAATLLVTALLLLVSLVITLISYKNVFFQIKRAQNEIEARQYHWVLEGGLECVYTKVHIDKDISKLTTTPADTTNYLKGDCIESFKTTDITVTDLSGKQLLIEPRIEDGSSIVKVGKILDMSSGRSSGAIKSTADLFIHGAIVISPPDPGGEQKAGWECMAIRYSNDLKMSAGIANNQFYDPINRPFSKFNANSKHCLDTHKTTDILNLKNDFYKDAQLSPFEEMFHQPASEWQKVKDDPNYQFEVLNMAKLTKNESVDELATFCGEMIEELIEDGHIRIWVEGNCGIEGDVLKEVTEASQDTTGVLLVVHNGVLSLKKEGNPKIDPFKGALFHFNDGFTPTPSDWAGLQLNTVKGSFETLSSDHKDFEKIAYLQVGAFVFTGGQILDMDNQVAYFNGAVNFHYNGDILDSIFGASNPRWLKGSWNDF